MTNARGFTAWLARWTFRAAMAIGVFMLFSASVSYLELGRAHPFFLEKLPLRNPSLWWVALAVHVPSALFALPACLILLGPRLRARAPRVHRWLGRVTGVVVLAGVVPSGLYLAFFAQGGLVTTLGFWLTGVITWVAMRKAIASARARDFKQHRRFATHVASQLSVAVLSRFLLVFADSIGLFGEWVYVAALYAPVIGCAALAELLTAPAAFRLWTSKGTRHEKLVVAARLDVVR